MFQKCCHCSEENSALKKDLQETKRSYKKLEDSKNSLTQEIKSMQKTLESLQSDQKSLSNVVSKLTAKAQDGGRSDLSSSQESDSDTESENEHESYVNPRNRKDFQEEDIKRSNEALPKPKGNPIQTTTGTNNKVKEIQKDGQRRPPHAQTTMYHHHHNQERNGSNNESDQPSLLFLCDSNGKYLRLKQLCPHHNVIYERCPTVEHAKSILHDIDPNENSPEVIMLHTGTNDLEHIQDQKQMAKEIYRLVSLASSKFPNSRILYSLLLPRDVLNAKVIEVNRLIEENTKSIKNLNLIYHTNVLSANQPILHDKKHLNRLGVTLFARQITRALYKDSCHNNATNTTSTTNHRWTRSFHKQYPPRRQSSGNMHNNDPAFGTYQQINTPNGVRQQQTRLYSDAAKHHQSGVIGRSAPIAQPQLLQAMKLLQGFFATFQNYS